MVFKGLWWCFNCAFFARNNCYALYSIFMISLCFLLAAPAPANNVEMDLFGSLSESFSSNALALVPSTSKITTSQGNANLDSTASFALPPSASSNFNLVWICVSLYCQYKKIFESCFFLLCIIKNEFMYDLECFSLCFVVSVLSDFACLIVYN